MCITNFLYKFYKYFMYILYKKIGSGTWLSAACLLFFCIFGYIH